VLLSIYAINATKAANNLYIHYKTMLYRLERIQEISGVNLEDKKDRLQIEMGLKISPLLGKID
jgi:purine catabolism regulator